MHTGIRNTTDNDDADENVCKISLLGGDSGDMLMNYMSLIVASRKSITSSVTYSQIASKLFL